MKVAKQNLRLFWFNIKTLYCHSREIKIDKISSKMTFETQ